MATHECYNKMMLNETLFEDLLYTGIELASENGHLHSSEPPLQI